LILQGGQQCFLCGFPAVWSARQFLYQLG